MSITLIITLITGYISYQAFTNYSLREKLIFHPYSISNNQQYYRFFTHGFIHADWNHLLINLFVLYQFGIQIETILNQILGPFIGLVIFITFYLSAIALATLPTYFRNISNPSYSALGASGATSALVFAHILFDPWGWFIFPPLPALVFGFAYLWYSSYMDRKGSDLIGHNTHFWGALYGIFFLIATMGWLRPEMLLFFLGQLISGPQPPPFF
mgnify:CR=1 FL=1